MKKCGTKRSERLIKDLETLLLNLQNKNNDYTFKRLYRIFFNEKYYKNINENIIDSLRNETFKVKSDNQVENLLNKILRAIFKINDKNIHKTILKSVEILKGKPEAATIDLSPLLESFNPRIAEKILRDKIEDERFIRLFNKYLKAEYPKLTNNKSYSKTLSGNPLDNTLMELYFYPLDKILEKENSIRYRNQLLISDISFCKKIKQFINEFYGIELKPIFKKAGQNIHFLSYELKLTKSGQVFPRVPQKAISDFILNKGMIKNIDEKPWHSVHRGYLLNLTDKEIFDIYNLELKNFYRFYAVASNVSRKLGQLKNIVETSCLKTLARKHRTRMNRVKENYHLGNSWGINEPFYKGFKRRSFNHKNIDLISNKERFKCR